ncbi:MAG TPA: hypothetical protein VNA28_17110 [Solirubrobacteraceae bacterium]|nr:hypothetical protein [Solirubrobacteraceae bacterium]
MDRLRLRAPVLLLTVLAAALCAVPAVGQQSEGELYLASKAEQDRLAAQLWNGGQGAANWVCVALVGAA